MTYSLRVADLPASERPRERLVAEGKSHLSTAELLAILLGTGQGPGKLSAVGLGDYILHRLGQNQRDPMAVLRDVSVAELTAIHGVGLAKASSILAAIELGKRVFQALPPERLPLESPEAAVAYLTPELMWEAQEHFAVLMLDIKNRPMATRVITIGTATETLAHPREIFREVIRTGSTRVIVAHNHPSGSVAPSPEDLALTRQLLQGAQVLGLPLLDHLILGGGQFTSLRQTTAIWDEYPQGV
ncbi:MAG: DNA repair protein RadC [Synechococcales cyanobacterium RU_4_20]|nr:DNA repair protein RadC [Synechococcales cyanobacterium RU_4_20]NJR69688.1 DNA repair protein RadC [Synechococcales cyanobacterium CRU_2_2]